jgi:hypothetical protein
MELSRVVGVSRAAAKIKRSEQAVAEPSKL